MSFRGAAEESRRPIPIPYPQYVAGQPQGLPRRDCPHPIPTLVIPHTITHVIPSVAEESRRPTRNHPQNNQPSPLTNPTPIPYPISQTNP